MTRPAPRTATALYATSGTCAVIGALLWLRGRPGSAYRAYIGFADQPPASSWRVWSSAVPQDRLGLYLLAAGLVLAVVAHLIAVWRE
ncbi:hypothetical protein [Actinacidiphila glaucinigra]|uniref:hypothetical protein n=1 Tax=Actinacidiphila glaucinigra TaxID=235986 RepID=UPI0029A6D8A1|nr:hypothetical protein [Streptomyces sp. PA03-3a]